MDYARQIRINYFLPTDTSVPIEKVCNEIDDVTVQDDCKPNVDFVGMFRINSETLQVVVFFMLANPRLVVVGTLTLSRIQTFSDAAADIF